ncbi:hypothetical protein HDU67_003673 [Dinochytrium kinnereticum]|nr:hypothetical protein HDU67_003673 [Dinochytrium kinnereticum]
MSRTAHPHPPPCDVPDGDGMRLTGQQLPLPASRNWCSFLQHQAGRGVQQDGPITNGICDYDDLTDTKEVSLRDAMDGETESDFDSDDEYSEDLDLEVGVAVMVSGEREQPLMQRERKRRVPLSSSAPQTSSRLLPTRRQMGHLRILALCVVCWFLLWFIPIKHTGLYMNPFTSPGNVAWSCGLNRGVALTYDDGPSIYSNELLDILSEKNVKVTFFLVGSRVLEHGDVVRRMVAEGHAIGSHSWSYQNLSALIDPISPDFNPKMLRDEVIKAEDAIKNVTGARPYLFRPPYGAISREIQNYLSDMGYTIVLWNVGCVNWSFDKHDTEHTAYLNGMPDAGELRRSEIDSVLWFSRI